MPTGAQVNVWRARSNGPPINRLGARATCNSVHASDELQTKLSGNLGKIRGKFRGNSEEIETPAAGALVLFARPDNGHLRLMRWRVWAFGQRAGPLGAKTQPISETGRIN